MLPVELREEAVPLRRLFLRARRLHAELQTHQQRVTLLLEQTRLRSCTRRPLPQRSVVRCRHQPSEHPRAPPSCVRHLEARPSSGCHFGAVLHHRAGLRDLAYFLRALYGHHEDATGTGGYYHPLDAKQRYRDAMLLKIVIDHAAVTVTYPRDTIGNVTVIINLGD